MTLKIIDKEIAGQSTAQIITTQLGIILKTEFTNQFNTYNQQAKFDVDIYLNNHSIYKKYLEDPAKVNSLINVLFTNATTDSLLSNGTIDITYNYKLQLITRANANTTLDEGATKIAADKMQELIFIITQIFTYHANMNPPLQLNNIHNLALSSYEVGALDENNTIDKYIGCMFNLKITAREYPLLSNINILQGFNIELDYNNKIIKLITDT